MTIFEFNKRFPTEKSAIDFIIETKYKDPRMERAIYG